MHAHCLIEEVMVKLG